MSPQVQGFCPMGCGETLFLGSGGFVTCSYLPCPNPIAVSDILAERETEHIVELGDGTFTVLHPLRERLDGQLLDCTIGEHVVKAFAAPVRPGRYRVYASADGWVWDHRSDGHCCVCSVVCGCVNAPVLCGRHRSDAQLVKPSPFEAESRVRVCITPFDSRAGLDGRTASTSAGRP